MHGTGPFVPIANRYKAARTHINEYYYSSIVSDKIVPKAATDRYAAAPARV